MGWHEIANDVVHGVLVALAYCALYGSGTLFQTPVDGIHYGLGSSGLLFRSWALSRGAASGSRSSLWSTGPRLRGATFVPDHQANT
jgi:hypothetical protein